MFRVFGSSSGGVVVASEDGKIVCENTLDARLDAVFKQKLPEVCIILQCKTLAVRLKKSMFTKHLNILLADQKANSWLSGCLVFN